MALEQIDTLLLNGIVVTMDAAGTILRDGGVAIQAGAIVAVGPSSELRERYTANQTIDCTNHAIVPGLINGHAHVPMSLLRGIVADQQLDVWLYGYMFPVESRFVNPEFVYHGTRLSCAEMIKGGITSFVDMYFYEEEVARAADQAGMRAICGQTVMKWPTPDAASYDEGLERTRRFFEQWKDHGRVIPAIAPHAPYTCNSTIYRAAADLAREFDVPLVTHLSETAREVEEARQLVDKSPIAYVADLDAFTDKGIAAHCVHIDKRDMQLLKKHNAGAVPCPTSNLKLASGVAKYGEMLQAGVNVGLGTDGPASNDDQDLWMEVHLAAILPKGVTGDPTVVTAKQAFAMATSMGAKAVHLDHLVGSLETGKRADITIVELGGLHVVPAPAYNYNQDAIYNHLVYSARSGDVRHVLIDGAWVMQDRQLLTLDENEVRINAMRIAETINQFLSQREVNLLDKILAIGGVKQAEIFEVQVKARLEDASGVEALLASHAVEITKSSERKQYDTYLLFDDATRGRIRYREDHRVDGSRIEPKYNLTLTMPNEREDLPSAVLLSRARYTAPADRSLRFYREYFSPDNVLEVEKYRRRWRIMYGEVDFAVNIDMITSGPAKGTYLEIKSRTWSARDAESKTQIISELLQLAGVSADHIIKQEYVELAQA
ncbi:amidohydrolase family protein [Herpetosiphon geysericola]|uniref:5-methylthioadenosine/S-adenosylhomocysteine deaminase n=1 Tax=Herpetosiphon geysericola TaxID=70996 RepID=A0A0P6YGC1_9CHLR|nr:amidohydrolase [Herpetosiphon geysericola]KPL81292.1 amidohydrolase [Herpetosiphon geysericola]